MAEKPTYVPIFENMFEALDCLDDADLRQVLGMIRAYVFEGEEPTDKGIAKAVFLGFKGSIDKTVAKQMRNTRAAQKRWARETESEQSDCKADAQAMADDAEPMQDDANAMQDRCASDATLMRLDANAMHPDANAMPNDAEEEEEEEKEDEEEEIKPKNIAPRARYVSRNPPTFAEWWERWQVKGREKGVPVCEAEAESAFSWYDANGWRQKSGNPIVSWKGALSTCFNKAHPELKDRASPGEPDPLDAYGIDAMLRKGA